MKTEGGKCRFATVSGYKVTARVKEVVDADPRDTVVDFAQEVGISMRSVSKILRHKLRHRKVCTRRTPYILRPVINRVRVENAQRSLGVYGDDDPRCLKDIVTGDETWVYFFQSKRKAWE